MWKRLTAAALSIGVVARAASAEPTPDPYAPLALYDGTWAVKPGSGAPMTVVNHCRRVATVFACEQVLGGKTGGILLIVPVASADRVLRYRTQFLHPNLTPLGDGSTLTIDGDDWVYGSARAPGSGTYSRTLNHFDGRDRIHFAQQSSSDGRTWTTASEGDEVRVPAPEG